jgi:hypothetical protein
MIQNDAGKADVFDHGRSRHSELVRPSSVLSSAAAQLLQKQSDADMPEPNKSLTFIFLLF